MLNIPDAPPELRQLLQRLAKDTGFEVSQHNDTPYPDEWFAGLGGGDAGPYRTAEDAIVGGVRWLRGLYEEAAREREEAQAELRLLKARQQAQDGNGRHN